MASGLAAEARRASRQIGVWYDLCRGLARATALAWFRSGRRGFRGVPSTGALVVVANHASFLDPVLVGVSTRRRLHFLARSSLFQFAPFGALIASLGAIPLDREGMGRGGLRSAWEVLKGGGAVLLFPEGTRSRDGTLAPLRSGALRLAQRSGAELLPVWIEGSQRALPRGSWFPRPKRVVVRFGETYRIAPAAPLEGAAMDLERRLLALRDGGRDRNATAGEPAVGE